MRADLVALDLETTGLDDKKDAIIEFGAVRMRDGEIVDSYSTLINPRRPIPPEITALTGIRDEDFLAKPHSQGEEPGQPAPTIEQVLPTIRAFVGDAIIIGHNVGFDLGFLRQQGVFQSNLWIDTYDLAAVLIPNAPRYSLSNLSIQLKIDLAEAHRALHDARASALLYWALWNKAITLPTSLIREIVNLSQPIDWNTRIFFEAVEVESTIATVQPSHSTSVATPHSETTIQGTISEAPQTISSILGPNGSLASILTDYESRPQQVEMAESIWNAFNDREHRLIEAATGVGKSLAYLTPAVLWAIKHQQRVIVSTNTINLQDQLINSDIPVLTSAFNKPFRSALLKGRGNYLCLRHFNSIRQRLPANVDELRIVAKLLIWLYEGGSGDKSEINLRGPAEQSVWSSLSAEYDQCSSKLCELATQGQCPFHKARTAAEAAQIVIVNHSLLMADAASKSQILPTYENLIVDEAHNFKDSVTESATTRIDEAVLHRALGDLINSHDGLLPLLIKSLPSQVPERELKNLRGFDNKVRAAISALETHIGNLFGALYSIVSRTGSSPPLQVRLTQALREKGNFTEVQNNWEIVNEFLIVMEEAVGRLGTVLNKLEEYKIPAYLDLQSKLETIARNITNRRQQLHSFIQQPDSNTVYWINLNQNHSIALFSAPLDISITVNELLMQTKESVIMTSATLQVGETFNYIQERLGIANVPTQTILSPFDYRASTLIFIPNDMPDPNERGKYQQAVERALIELAASLNGRTLALFTSYTQLLQTAQAIRPRLTLGGITVYDQIDTNNRQALLDNFKTTEKAILLGTRSFWEGVDIPGAALSALAITKLPFPVPNEPIFAARSDLYKDAFNEYVVPETIIRFRQGFGRLIRTQKDRGVVALFDRRIMSKNYGSRFLEALPDCTIQYGKLESIGEIAMKWVSKA